MTRRRRMMERHLATEAEASPPPTPVARAGVVRAIGSALGEQVIELDPTLCDPAFVRDRFAGGDDHALTASIEASGQAVPILVRPHPRAPGRYEIAYGHRRWRACETLGRPLRAVVRPLSDDDLVVAQGRENGERRDLTFIERATFAAALIARGTPRKVVGQALGVDKTELSRLLTVANGLPNGLAEAIGPAPRTGRPRWLRLVKSLEGRDPAPAFAAAKAAADSPSDARFTAVLATLSGPSPAPQPFTVRRTGGRTIITIDDAAASGFGAHLAAELDAHFAAFQTAKTAR